MFKKEPFWNTISKEDKIKAFDAHLVNLNTRCTPGVEVIQPNRSGSYPFLKVTFVSKGEKNNFFHKNKQNINKYATSNMVPQAISPKQMEIKESLKKTSSLYIVRFGIGYRTRM